MTPTLGFARASLVMTCALAIACGSDTTSPEGPRADLRLLHATSSLGALDVVIGGETLISNVQFGSSSPITRVPAGAQHVTLRSGGTVVGNLDVQLSTQHVNAIVVAGGVPQFANEVNPDTGQVDATRANLRLVNVVAENTDPPTDLEVWLNGPSVPADSIAKFTYDATVARYSSLMYFDPGHFRIRYVPKSGTTVLAQAEFDIAAGVKKAAILSRDTDGTYHVQIVVEP